MSGVYYIYMKVNALCTGGKADAHSVPQKRKRSGFRGTPLQAWSIQASWYPSNIGTFSFDGTVRLGDNWVTC